MIVYHGTILNYAMDIINNGIDLNASKKYLDFGRGFYVTPNYDMAKNMAKRVAAINKKENVLPAIVSFEYDENLQLNIKKFKNEDMEWAKFIMANRLTAALAKELGLQDINDDKQYDIVIGGTADGNVASIASDLRNGKLASKDYKLKVSDMLKSDESSYGTQIVFCTEKALACIKYIKCDII